MAEAGQHHTANARSLGLSLAGGGDRETVYTHADAFVPEYAKLHFQPIQL